MLGMCPLGRVAVRPQLKGRRCGKSISPGKFTTFTRVYHRPLVCGKSVDGVRSVRHVRSDFPALSKVVVKEKLLVGPTLTVRCGRGGSLSARSVGRGLCRVRGVMFTHCRRQLRNNRSRLLGGVGVF